MRRGVEAVNRQFCLSCTWWLGCVAALGLASGCGSDSMYGDGGDANAAVTTPAGVQSGDVSVVYILTGEDDSTTDINVSYSRDGVVYRQATDAGTGDGTQNLSVSDTGAVHTFVWDSANDMPGEREENVVIRVRPENGDSDQTTSVTVHNARYLVGVEDEEIGRVRLYSVDNFDGDVVSIANYPTNGTYPHDVIHDDGYFFVVHRFSNDVAVFELDEENDSLIEVERSPFHTDGIGSRYLATDGDFVFVSNTDSDTITVFEFSPSAGELTLSPFSNMSVADVEGIIVRSNRLYAASEASDQILIFDIMSDGELLTNAASPITGSGLSQPGTFARYGSVLYVANRGASTICAFSVDGSGGLTAVAGSPFTASGLVERLAVGGGTLVGTRGETAELLVFSIDTVGALTELASSPIALGGSSFTVVATSAVVVAPTTTPEELEVFTIDSTDDLVETSDNPENASAPLLRAAFSN